MQPSLSASSAAVGPAASSLYSNATGFDQDHAAGLAAERAFGYHLLEKRMLFEAAAYVKTNAPSQKQPSARPVYPRAWKPHKRSSLPASGPLCLPLSGAASLPAVNPSTFPIEYVKLSGTIIRPLRLCRRRCGDCGGTTASLLRRSGCAAAVPDKSRLSSGPPPPGCGGCVPSRRSTEHLSILEIENSRSPAVAVPACSRLLRLQLQVFATAGGHVRLYGGKPQNFRTP